MARNSSNTTAPTAPTAPAAPATTTRKRNPVTQRHSVLLGGAAGTLRFVATQRANGRVRTFAVLRGVRPAAGAKRPVRRGCQQAHATWAAALAAVAAGVTAAQANGWATRTGRNTAPAFTLATLPAAK